MTRDIATVLERLHRVRSAVDRYDLVLAVVPVAFLVAALARAAFDVPLEAALLGGFAISVLAVIDGLFLHPPSGVRRA